MREDKPSAEDEFADLDEDDVPKYSKRERTRYDLSLLRAVGYRGGDNSLPGDLPPRKSPRFHDNTNREQQRLGYRGGDNAFPGDLPPRKSPELDERPLGYRGGDNALPGGHPPRKGPRLRDNTNRGRLGKPVSNDEKHSNEPPQPETQYQKRAKKKAAEKKSFLSALG